MKAIARAAVTGIPCRAAKGCPDRARIDAGFQAGSIFLNLPGKIVPRVFPLAPICFREFPCPHLQSIFHPKLNILAQQVFRNHHSVFIHPGFFEIGIG